MKSLLLLILLVSLAALPAVAADFPAATAAQITTALASVQPGDTITMAAGTWANAHIVFRTNGTADKPVLLRSKEGYGSVVLNGTSTLRIAGNYLVVDGLKFQGGYSASGDVIDFHYSGVYSSYSRLTNSGVIDYNPSNDSTDYKWISIYGQHNRVDHCCVQGKTHSGTSLVVWRPTTAPDYHLIDHNYFGPRPVLGYNGGETIRVGTSDQSQSSSYTVVEYNYFDRCNGEIEIISNKSCDNVFRYNTFVSCQGMLTLRHGKRARVEGNFFFQNHVANSGGIRIIDEDHVVVNNYISGCEGSSLKHGITLMDGIPNSPLNGYYQVKRALVAFNTLVDNRYSIDIGGGKSSDNTLPAKDCVIANNLVVGTDQPLVTQTDTADNLKWEGNIFYGTSTGFLQNPSGITVLDPKLGPAGSDGLRRPLPGSPVIGGAQGSYPTVVLDVDSQVRDSLKDVGADQVSDLPVLTHPMQLSEVGPLSATPSSVPEHSEKPRRTGFGTVWPNPFNPMARLTYMLGNASDVTLSVYDLLGRIVTTLDKGFRMPGEYTCVWNPAGQGLSTGIYYCRLTADGIADVRAIVYAR
jgi:poly(beta-D-mannuronate) lyase